MNNNDEQLPPELAAFVARLKTLKPVAFENARNSSREPKVGRSRRARRSPHSIRSLRYTPFPAAIHKMRSLFLYSS